MRPRRKPNVGWKIYEKPPPSAKIGTPTRPMSTYTACDSAPYPAPNSTPAIAVKRNCSEMAASANGILKKAPTAVRAAKSAQRIIVLVFMVPPEL